MKEHWVAVRKDEEFVYFEVTCGKNVREERRYIDALPLMFALGGYPPVMGAVLGLQEIPWEFDKVGEHIYVPNPK